MKATIFIIVSFIALGNAQLLFSQSLSFTYDDAGNQSKREWVCVNCPQSSEPGVNRYTNNGQQLTESIKVGDIIVSTDSKDQTIELSWVKESTLSLQQIEIFDAEGTCVFSTSLKPSLRSEKIHFSRLPAGDYRLSGQYSNKKKFSVQVIKI